MLCVTTIQTTLTPRCAAAARRQESMRKPALVDVTGKSVYIHAHVGAAAGALETWCAEHMMQVDHDPRIGSDVYIVPTPGSIDLHTRLAVILNGAMVCDPPYLLEDARKGSCIVYKPAIMIGGNRNRPRMWWASTAFRAQRPAAYAMIKHFSRCPHSVWRETESYEDFADYMAENMRGPPRQHRPLQGIVLVADSQPLADKNFFTLPGLMDKFQAIDVTRSTVGVCGL